MVKDTIKICGNKFSKPLEMKEESKRGGQQEIESEKKVIEENKQNEEEKDNNEKGNKTERKKAPKFLGKKSLLKMKTLNI